LPQIIQNMCTLVDFQSPLESTLTKKRRSPRKASWGHQRAPPAPGPYPDIQSSVLGEHNSSNLSGRHFDHTGEYPNRLARTKLTRKGEKPTRRQSPRPKHWANRQSQAMADKAPGGGPPGKIPLGKKIKGVAPPPGTKAGMVRQFPRPSVGGWRQYNGHRKPNLPRPRSPRLVLYLPT